MNTHLQNTRCIATLSCLLALFLGQMLSSVTISKAQSTSTTSIHTGDSWKGTESNPDTNGGNSSPTSLNITSTTANPPYSIIGYWGNSRAWLFDGNEETYAQAYPGSLTDVIKIWGKSPIDRYITFIMTGTILGYIVEEANGDFKGIYIGIMGQVSWTKFILHKVVPPPSRTKMFVYLEGLTSSLSQKDASSGNLPTDSFGQKNGIGIFLKKQYPGSLYTMFSYTGSTGIGQPLKYECQDTFKYSTSVSISKLKLQITHLMQNKPNLDIYLIGHSYGGALAMALLADLKIHGNLHYNGGSIKGIITLDSPLGGVPGGFLGIYYQLAAGQYQTDCKALKTQRITLSSLIDLTKVFIHTGLPYGGNGMLMIVVNGGDFSNQELARYAASMKIFVMDVGNSLDYTFNFGACPGYGQLPDSHFSSTEWVSDQGNRSLIYGRVFSDGVMRCSDIKKLAINHGRVFTYPTVQAATKQVIDNNTPNALNVAPG